MVSARRAKFYIWLTELTSIPLTALMAVFILTGYGMVSPVLHRLGLSYALSAALHTSPLLRILLVTLTALHGCAGLAVLTFKRVKVAAARILLEVLLLALTLAFCAFIAYVELSTLGVLSRGLRHP